MNMLVKCAAVLSLMISVNSMAETSLRSSASHAERIVVDFYEQVFVHKTDVKKVAEEYMHPDYIQHNPYVPDGRDGMVTALSAWMKKRHQSVKTTIKKVFSDGDYVILHVHQKDTAKDEAGHAGMDIFRVENGKIMEHWDVWQKIPETMPHDNGMF